MRFCRRGRETRHKKSRNLQPMGGVSQLMEGEQEQTWKRVVHEIAIEGRGHVIPIEDGE